MLADNFCAEGSTDAEVKQAHALIRQAVARLGSGQAEAFDLPPKEHYCTPRQIKDWLSRAGLTITGEQDVEAFPGTVYRYFVIEAKKL